jgi:hypothetical protein
MRLAMPNMPESLTYSVVGAMVFAGFAALVLLLYGDLLAALLLLAVLLAVYWLVGRNLVTIVTAGEAAAATGVLFVLCAVADLVTGYPYEAVLFLLTAVMLGFAFLLLQQGTVPIELRFGRVVAVASPSGLIHLRMLQELRDAGIVTADEFEVMRSRIGV